MNQVKALQIDSNYPFDVYGLPTDTIAKIYHLAGVENLLTSLSIGPSTAL